MFWYLIANPVAGNGAVRRRWPDIERRLQALGFSYTIHFTESAGHAARLAENAILKGHRYIMGLGGDGTHHEILNGVLSQSFVPSHEICYAPFPIGTGNDWARTYGIPQAPEQRLQRLLQPQIRFQDAGKVQYNDLQGRPSERWFINVAGMAYDGYVAKRLEEDGKSSARLAYLMAVSRYLFEYELTKARIEYDDAPPVEDFFYTINAGICRYSGGGMQLVPHAIPDDGLLAFTFARQLPRWEVLLQTYRFYNGTLLSHPRLFGAQVKNIRVTPLSNQGPLWLEADGEFLGCAPAVFSILEKAVQVAI